MSAWLEARLNKVWYGARPPGLVLRGLERVYRAGLQRAQEKERAALASDLVDRPIIVVGNITAGGTGKTPLVVRLCQLLMDGGLRPGVISTGYGRRGQGYLLVEPAHSAKEVGDEPLLISRRTGVPVLVGPDRVEAARRLLAQPVDVVISDDGLQRLRLPRRFEICVVDGARGLGNGRLLPAGPLRESADRLERVDAVVVNGPSQGGAGQYGPHVVSMQIVPGCLTRIRDGLQLDPQAWRTRYAGAAVHAMAGLGHPQRFFDTLNGLGIGHHAHPFADHHDYSAGDFEKLNGAVVVMSEKDAVKCTAIAPAEAWYLPVEACLPVDWEAGFLQQVRAMLETEQN